MRAPPQPRKSKTRFFTVYITRLQQFFTLYKVKKRWHLHNLHVTERKGKTIVSPISAIRAEDMINLPTAIQNKACKQKPLLIASFPKGCSRSPRVKVLQRNRLSQIFVSRRKYKLKYFDVSGIKEVERQGVPDMSYCSHRCAYTVRSLKKATSKNADLKIIFHDRNTIKSFMLGMDDNCLESPELLQFGPSRSIRIKDYPTLNKNSRNHLDGLAEQALPTNKFDSKMNAKSGFDSLAMNNGITDEKRIKNRKRFILIKKYIGSNMLLSHSQKLNSL